MLTHRIRRPTLQDLQKAHTAERNRIPLDSNMELVPLSQPPVKPPPPKSLLSNSLPPALSRSPSHQIPLPPLPKPLTVNPVNDFLVGKLSEGTRKAYRADLKWFLLWLARPEAFQSPEGLVRVLMLVDRNMAALYRDHLLESGLAASTIGRKFSLLNGVYNALKADGLILRNPFEWVKRPKISSEGRTPAFSKEQAELLLSLPDMSSRMGRRDKVIFMLLLHCALRRSELVRVKLSDFYSNQGHVVLKVHGKGKSGKTDLVKVPPHVWKAVSEYVKRNYVEPDEYLFSGHSLNPKYNKSNRHLSPTRLYLLIKNYCRRGGLDADVFTVHSTRATAITLALDGGASVRQVQAMARHVDPKTTMRYDRGRENLNNNGVDYIRLEG